MTANQQQQKNLKPSLTNMKLMLLPLLLSILGATIDASLHVLPNDDFRPVGRTSTTNELGECDNGRSCRFS